MVKRDSVGTIAAAAPFLLLWVLMGSFTVDAALQHDFLNLYTGARMALAGEFDRLHDPDLQFAREKETRPEADTLVPFVRPHFYALLLSPMALLPYQTAFRVWLGVQVAVLTGLWLWAYRRFGPDAVFWGAVSLPCCLGIAHGQDCVFMLAIAIAGYSLAERGKNAWAGAVWALALMKFHLVLLLFPAMLVSKRWRMAGGFAAGASTLLAACLALGGISGLQLYAAMLGNKSLDRLSPTPEYMIGAQGLLTNLGATGAVPAMILAAAVAVAVLIAVRNLPLWAWFSITVLGSLAAVPHVYGYDAAIAVLPVWLVQHHASGKWKLAAGAFAAPVASFATLGGSPWAVASALSLFAFLAVSLWHAASGSQSTGLAPSAVV